MQCKQIEKSCHPDGWPAGRPMKIKEIPVKMSPNPFGKSMHRGIKPVYYVFKILLSVFVSFLRKNPKESNLSIANLKKGG